MGGILNSEAFPTMGLELLSLLCLCLMHARTHTHTQFGCYRFLLPTSPHSMHSRTPTLLHALQQSLGKGLLRFQSAGPQHFSRQLYFLTAFQMDASGLIVYHGTHTQALISPHSFFGHRVSLCFGGHGNLSPKHIL